MYFYSVSLYILDLMEKRIYSVFLNGKNQRGLIPFMVEDEETLPIGKVPIGKVLRGGR